MPNEQLLTHIRSEFSRGVDRTAVIRSLLAAGWKVEDINSAIASVDGVPARSTPPTPPMPRMQTMQAQQAYTAPQFSSSPSPVKTAVQNIAAGLFITCVFVLTIVSILGVWKFFSSDVITKSFETLGLLAFVAVVVIVASKFVGDPSVVAEPEPSPGYRAVRNVTLATLITSSSLLALLGVLSIWDVITDKGILNKSLSSLAIIAFSSFIVVLVCLEREQNPIWKKRGGQISGGAILVAILFIWLMFALLG